MLLCSVNEIDALSVGVINKGNLGLNITNSWVHITLLEFAAQIRLSFDHVIKETWLNELFHFFLYLALAKHLYFTSILYAAFLSIHLYIKKSMTFFTHRRKQILLF